MSSANRVVVVGAASGIGAHTLDRYLERGAEVIAVDHRPVSNSSAKFIECDLRDPDSIAAAAAALPDGIDVIAHVAGIPDTHPADQVIKVNFLGLRHFLQQATPKVSSGGAVTVVASTAGTAWLSRLAAIEGLLATDSMDSGMKWVAANLGDYSPYSLSKEATIAFVKRWSSTIWREQGVRLNLVSPGPVETPILVDFEQTMGKDMLDGVRGLVGRHATTGDIVPVIEAISSPAFGWVVGQDLQVDAGFVASIYSGAVAVPGQ